MFQEPREYEKGCRVRWDTLRVVVTLRKVKDKHKHGQSQCVCIIQVRCSMRMCLCASKQPRCHPILRLKSLRRGVMDRQGIRLVSNWVANVPIVRDEENCLVHRAGRAGIPKVKSRLRFIINYRDQEQLVTSILVIAMPVVAMAMSFSVMGFAE